VGGDTSRAALEIEAKCSVLVLVAENGVSPATLELRVDDEGDVTRSKPETLFAFNATTIAKSNASLAAGRDGRLCIFDHAVFRVSALATRTTGVGHVSCRFTKPANTRRWARTGIAGTR